MMINAQALLSLLGYSLLLALPAGFLAQEKGRNVVLWSLLALIPIINIAAIIYIVGTPDKRLLQVLNNLAQSSGPSASQ